MKRTTAILFILLLLIFTSCADIEGYTRQSAHAGQPEDISADNSGDTVDENPECTTMDPIWGTGEYPKSIITDNLNILTTPSGVRCQFSSYDFFDGDYYTITPSTKSLEAQANFLVHSDIYGNNCFSFTYSASAQVKCIATYTSSSASVEDTFVLEAGTDVEFTHYIIGAEEGNKLGNYFRMYFTVDETAKFRMPDIFFSDSNPTAQ